MPGNQRKYDVLHPASNQLKVAATDCAIANLDERFIRSGNGSRDFAHFKAAGLGDHQRCHSGIAHRTSTADTCHSVTNSSRDRTTFSIREVDTAVSGNSRLPSGWPKRRSKLISTQPRPS